MADALAANCQIIPGMHLLFFLLEDSFSAFMIKTFKISDVEAAAVLDNSVSRGKKWEFVPGTLSKGQTECRGPRRRTSSPWIQAHGRST